MMLIQSLKVTLLTLFAFALTCWLPTETAAAHGEDSALQVDQTPAGDALLTVMTSPASLHVGATHFAVLITDRQSKQPLLGKEVRVEAIPLAAGGEMVASPAFLAPTLAYETHLVLPKAGRYRVFVSVVEANRTKHTISFEVHVRSVTLFQWLTLLLSAQSFVIAGWLLREGFIVWRRSLHRLGSTGFNTDHC
jgi:hypothetical protein